MLARSFSSASVASRSGRQPVRPVAVTGVALTTQTQADKRNMGFASLAGTRFARGTQIPTAHFVRSGLTLLAPKRITACARSRGGGSGRLIRNLEEQSLCRQRCGNT